MPVASTGWLIRPETNADCCDCVASLGVESAPALQPGALGENRCVCASGALASSDVILGEDQVVKLKDLLPHPYDEVRK